VERLFWERFYRGEDVHARDARGAGLGLALALEDVAVAIASGRATRNELLSWILEHIP